MERRKESIRRYDREEIDKWYRDVACVRRRAEREGDGGRKDSVEIYFGVRETTRRRQRRVFIYCERKREGEATVHAGRERPPLHHHPYPYHRLLFADAAAVG